MADLGRVLPMPLAEPGKPKAKSQKAEEARNLAVRLLEDAAYQDSLKRRLIAGAAPHMETLMWHYAYGKPTEVVDFQGELTVSKVIREIIDVPRIIDKDS